MELSALAWVMGLIGAFTSSNGTLGDVFPAADFWRIQQVKPTREAMLAELATGSAVDVDPLIAQLGDDRYSAREQAQAKLIAAGPSVLPKIRPLLNSDDAEVANRAKVIIEKVSAVTEDRAIRQMMALRMLADLKDRQALPAVQAMTRSDNPVLAETARMAAAAIEGKEYAPTRPTAEKLAEDVQLLPPGTGFVGQIRPVEGGLCQASLRDLIEVYMKAMPDDQVTMDEAMEHVLANLYLPLLRMTGPLRVDGITVGVSQQIGENEGFVVVVARGLYHSRAAWEKLVHARQNDEETPRTETIEGVRFFRLASNSLVAMPDDRTVVLVAGPRRNDLPLAAVAGAMKGTSRFSENKELAALAAKVDRKGPVWAAATLPKEFRPMPLLSNVSRVTVSSSLDDEGTLHLGVEAEAWDEEKAISFVGILNANLTFARRMLSQESDGPLVEPLAQALKSLQMQRSGNTITGKMSVPVEAWRSATLLPLVMTGF